MSSFDRLEPGIDRIDDFERSLDTNIEYQDSVKAGDWSRADRALTMQRRQAGMATIEVLDRGGDPRYETAPIGAFVDRRVEVERRFLEFARKQRELDDVLANNGFDQIKTFMNDIANRYKARNQERLITEPKTEEDFIKQIEQNQPVVVDPNEVANIRQLATKLDAAMRAVDPKTSFFTNPKTKAWGEWLNREAGMGGVGYFTSGEQQLGTSAIQTMALEATEGLMDFPTNAVQGIWSLADRAVRALGGPGLPQPTNFIEDEEGRPVSNAGKAPSFMDSMAMLYAAATDRHIGETVAAVQETRQMDAEQRSMLENIAFGASRVIGMGFGFGLPAGAVMNAGSRGFGLMATGGLRTVTKLVAKDIPDPRTLKIVKMLGSTFGASAANGAAEAVAYGNQDGYAKAFMHGMAIAPVLMAFGWMGNRTQHWLQQKKMPGRMAASLAGALEGVGFGTLETVEAGHLWQFIKDPNQTTFETYAKNVLGFMLFKGAFGHVPTAGELALGITPEAKAQMYRAGAREEFARKVARGEATAEELAKVPVESVPKLKQLGELSIRRQQAQSATEEMRLREEQKGVETELDITEYGIDKPKEVAELDKLEREQGPLEVTKDPGERSYLEMKMEDLKNRRKKLLTHTGELGKISLRETARDPERVREIDEQIAEIERRLGTYKEEPKAPPGTLEKLLAEQEGRGPKKELLEHQIKGEKMEPLPVEEFPWQERRVEEVKKPETPEERAFLEDRLQRLREQEKRAHDQPTPIMRGEQIELTPKEKIAAEIRKIERQLGLAEERRVSTREESQTAVRQALEAQQGRGPREVTPDALVAFGKRNPGWEPTDSSRAMLREAYRKTGNEDYLRLAEKHKIPSEAKLEVETPGGEATKVGQEGVAAEAEIKNLPSGVRQGPGSLQVPPTRELVGQPGVEPQRAMDIIAEMEGRPGRAGVRVPFTSKRLFQVAGDVVRVPIRFGRVVLAGATKGTLGIFRLFENLARTQEGRDLVVAAHEWSHAMQRHLFAKQGGQEFNNIVHRWQAALPQEVLTDIGVILRNYPGSATLSKTARAMEAWAEWHARNLLGDATLFAEVPHLTRVMQDILAQPQNARLRNQYYRIQDMLYRYNAQGAEQRVRMSWTSPADLPSATQKATKPSLIQRASDAIVHSMYNDAAYLIRSMERWLSAVGKTRADLRIMEDPVRVFDALRMTAEKVVGHWISKSMDIPGVGKISSLKSIIGLVKGKVPEFTDYIVAVRNAQLLKQGKKAQLPMRDYVYTIKQLQTRNPEFRSAARELKKWTDGLVDYVAASGAIGADSAQRIKDAYVVYAPFFREIEGPRRQPGGRGVAERGSGLARIHGAALEIKDPIGALQGLAVSLVSKAHQYMVMKAGYRMAQRHEAGGFMSRVRKDLVPHNHPVKEVLNAVKKKITDPTHELVFDNMIRMLEQAGTLSDDVITLFTQKTIPTGTRSIVAFTPRLNALELRQTAMDRTHRKLLKQEQGKVQWYEMDTEAYETLMGIDKAPSLGWFDKPVLREILTYPAAVTRFFATGINIGFTAANIPRDMLAYTIYQGKFMPFAGIAQWTKGAALYLHRKGDIRQLYDSLGVRTASFYSEGQRMELLEQHRSIIQKTRHTLSRIVDKAKAFLEAPENFLRIAEFRDVYEAAKKGGASETEARIRAIEAGREITVNFARGGILARAMNQVIPYFNAALQSQRKTFKQLALGGDAVTDRQRARVQRMAFANAISSITMPSMVLWAINHDDEWYQDLPEWRKTLYWNFKWEDGVLSIPKPFELGVMFGSIPEWVGDSLIREGHPVPVKELFVKSLLSYLDGPAALLPAFLRPLIEGQFNFSAFHDRPLTPEWIAKGRIPAEQATFYTSEIAKILSKAINGILTPIEIEHYLGGYSAGKAVDAMRAADELFALKDHPGLALNPIGRFTKQEVHGQSRTVDFLYELSTKLDQMEGSEKITVQQTQLKGRVDTAKRQISAIRRAYEQGRMSRDEANKRSYQLAKPLIEAARRQKL